jgi:23S rRNA pseudouridine1911/1915/1917 synthase
MDERVYEVAVPLRKSKERMDAFLSREIPGCSRSKIQKAIKDGLVSVNGQPVKPDRAVRPGETIHVRIPKPPPAILVPEAIPLDVVYEDGHLVVVNKPAGMVVHPACGHSTGTLVNALLGRSASLSLPEGLPRPGIVHRLDKETSGLLVVAKNDMVHQALANQFSAKTAHREYAAVVWGRFPKGKGTVAAHLGRSRRDRRRFAVVAEGKHAVTHFQVAETFAFLSYLRLILETGRTHQIRVHMAHLGHPVFGDAEYGGRQRMLAGLRRFDVPFALELLSAMPRQALHARTLGFVHPVTGESLRFESDLPRDMGELLERLRKSRQTG